LSGKWKQLKGSVRQAWGELTDDEVDQIAGRRDQLAGKLQQKYGYSKMEAGSEIDSFLRDAEQELNDAAMEEITGQEQN